MFARIETLTSKKNDENGSLCFEINLIDASGSKGTLYVDDEMYFQKVCTFRAGQVRQLIIFDVFELIVFSKKNQISTYFCKD